MRTLALLLVAIFPAAALAMLHPAAPAVLAVGRPIRVEVINMSGKHREVLLKSGALLDLPAGVLVGIETAVGATILVVSDTDASVNERIVVRKEDGARIVPVR